jgi:hypothetical protein
VFTQFDVLVSNWLGQKMMSAMRNGVQLDQKVLQEGRVEDTMDFCVETLCGLEVVR